MPAEVGEPVGGVGADYLARVLTIRSPRTWPPELYGGSVITSSTLATPRKWGGLPLASCSWRMVWSREGPPGQLQPSQSGS